MQIGRGEIVTVLGPSGCGKTTLLNIVAGFLRPTAGEVRVGDRPVTGPGPERGMVFQQGALFEWLTVAGNVSFGPRMAGRPRDGDGGTVAQLLHTVGLAGFGGTAGLPALGRHAAAGGAGALPRQRSRGGPDGRAARRARRADAREDAGPDAARSGRSSARPSSSSPTRSRRRCSSASAGGDGAAPGTDLREFRLPFARAASPPTRAR